MPHPMTPPRRAAGKQKTKEKPTLKTIARISGLAVPTVSRALNDAPDIGNETKKLIRKIAKEIGYVPNRAGVRLRTGRTNVISLVMSTEHDPLSYTARLIEAVAGGLRNTPFHLNVMPFFPDQDPMETIQYIVENGTADAIIMNQIQPNDARVAYLMQRGFPFAAHGRSNWADKHPYYDYDNKEFGILAVKKLAERARKQILLIAPPAAQAYGQHMIAGATETALSFGVNVTIADDITSDTPNPVAVAWITQYLKEHPETDAVITGSTSSAMAAVAAIESNGNEVGNQVDVFSKEALPFLKLLRANILTISENVDNAGAFLAKAAIQAVKQPEEPPMQALEVPLGDSV